MKRQTTWIAMVLWIALAAIPDRCAAQQSDIESNLKAAFIYNFTKYIEWPPDDENTFTIGVVGASELDEALKEISISGTINNKKIVIRHFDKLDQIGPCRVLVISHRSKFNLTEVLARAGKGVLSIGEEAGTARNGVIFDFIRVGDKLRFELNTKALNASGLKISSQLLRLAIIIE